MKMLPPPRSRSGAYALRTLLVLFLACVLLALGGTALQLRRVTQQNTRLQRELALRVTENDLMRADLLRREKAQIESANRVRRAEVEREVEKIRGLKFLHPVEYAVVTRAEILGVISGKLAETYSEEDIAHIAAALSRLGLLPEGFPLRQRYLELLGEQIAAFYDQHSHKLFMFEDATLETTQNRVILAHELTHALQDQHFDLLKMPLEIKDNDDVAMATSALVEGEATLVMSAYMMRGFSLRGLKESVSTALLQDTRQLAQAPPYLRETLLFPYLRGQEFCTALTGSGGYEALTRCYARRPSSTAEILHPERYTAAWQPGKVSWPEMDFEGAPAPLSNVVGEAGLRIQLAPALDGVAAAALAASWQGDRYLHFASLDALVWKTVWSTPAAAADFLKAEQRVLETRYGAAKATRSFIFTLPRPDTVILADSPDLALSQRLLTRFGR